MSNGISEGITKRCVPLTQGALGPDLRVNYEFGLVLGVDEFRQEQLYHLGNDYLHHRGLHGFGTVSGLEVSLRGPEAPEVMVSPGIGVDQLGRTFVVRYPQCASLADWLANQENPSAINAVYVVAEYDECLDALVPIAGQPCSSSAQNQAESRIRRAFNIRLQAQPPVMEGWAAARRLGELMSHVELVPDLDSNDTDEMNIIELVRLLLRTGAYAGRLTQLRDAAAAEGRTGWKFLRLSLATAQQALARILTVWVTEVRPQLTPDLIDPGEDAEAAILLATLRRVDESGDEVPSPNAVGGWVASDQARPFLLSTQVIQSLLFMGEAASEAVGAGLMREFVSIDTVPIPRGQRLMLSMWFHLDEPPKFGDNAVSIGRVLNDRVVPMNLVGPADTTGANGNHMIWSMRPPGRESPLEDGQLLEIRFNTDQVRLGNRTLTQVLQDEDYGYLGYDGENTLTVYYIVDAPQVAQQPQPGGLTEAEVQAMIDAVRTVPFVTITPVAFETPDMITYELWFHMDVQFTPGGIPEVGLLEGLSEENFRVYVELPGERLGRVEVQNIDQERGNIYTLFADGSKLAEEYGEEPGVGLRYLRFVFLLKSDLKITTRAGTFTIPEYMDNFDIKFEGYFSEYALPEGDAQNVIVSYVRSPAMREQ